MRERSFLMNPAVDPFDALVRKVGSDGVSAAIEATRESLGSKCNPTERALIALTLCRLGTMPVLISTWLDWREFERICSGLVRSSGFAAREDARPRNPRGQSALIAMGPSRT